VLSSLKQEFWVFQVLFAPIYKVSFFTGCQIMTGFPFLAPMEAAYPASFSGGDIANSGKYVFK